MFKQLFEGLPPIVAKAIKQRLEAQILSISEDNVADVKATLTLVRDIKREIAKTMPRA